MNDLVAPIAAVEEALRSLRGAHVLLSRVSSPVPKEEFAAALQRVLAAHPFMVEGSHECLQSLTGTCWYNTDFDPTHDGCVWCAEPEERK